MGARIREADNDLGFGLTAPDHIGPALGLKTSRNCRVRASDSRITAIDRTSALAGPDPLNPSILEYDLDEGKGKDDEQEPAHGGADYYCAEAG
jgi:hypothetical protein